MQCVLQQDLVLQRGRQCLESAELVSVVVLAAIVKVNPLRVAVCCSVLQCVAVYYNVL